MYRAASSWVLLLLLCVSGPPVYAQGAVTQQLQVREGWNLLSLHVEPASAGVQDIFAGHLDDLLIMQNDDGQAFIPSLGIDEIGTWDHTQGYLLFAWSPFVLEVEGTRVSTDPPPVELASGWSFIPYFPTQAMPVEEALDSLGDKLVTAKQVSGPVYYPQDGVVSLDSLHPGYGYQVFLSDEGLLQYPAEVPPAHDTTQVSTLADALSLNDLSVGHIVEVEGYHESGDEGGGLFIVTDDAMGTDGATSFIFEEDLSADTQFSTGAELGWNKVNLPHQALDWGSIRVRYGPDPEDEMGVLHMHGHGTAAGSDSPTSLINTTAGTIGALGNDFKNLREGVGYQSTQYDITYRYATSNRRLVRQNVTDHVNVAWWGAPKADEADPQEADMYVAWAVNKANELYEAGSFNWAYVDIAGEYFMLHEIRLRSGVKLRGAGELNADGYTRGKLTYMPGQMLYHRLNGYDRFEDTDRERVHGALGDREKMRIVNHRMAEKIGIKDLWIEGNTQNNMQVWNNWANYGGAAAGTWLQNSGDWSGFYTTGTGNDIYLDEMPVEINDVLITNTGSNNLAAAGEGNDPPIGPRFTTSNVTVRNSARNHLIYGITGDPMDGLTLEGHLWGGNPFSGGAFGPAKFTNLIIRNIETNPYGFGFNTIIGDRFNNVEIDGFEIDLSESTDGAPDNEFRIIRAQGVEKTIKNGIIRGFTSENFTRARFELLSFDSLTPNPHIRPDPTDGRALIENVDIYDHGQPLLFHTARNGWASNMIFRNVTYQMAEGVPNELAEIRPFQWELGGGYNHRSKARFTVYEDFEYHRGYDGGGNGNTIHIVSGNEGNAPLDIYFVRGLINNQPRWNVFFSPGGGHNLVRVFMNEFTFNLPDPSENNGGAFHSRWRPGGHAKMRNSTDSIGRVSDNNGIFTSEAADEGNDYVLVPTNLISRFWEHEVTLDSAPTGMSVTSVEVANSDGSLRADNNEYQHEPYIRVNLSQAIGAGEQVTVDWAVRVTALDEYQTTGLFIARPVPEQTLTLSEGSVNIDLRGVASSQETQEVITYTATSNDGSVVQAEVGSDGYTLTLTPQGTGSTSIVVGGDMPGVGAAEQTLSVTVE